MDYLKLRRISVYFAVALQCLSSLQAQVDECSPRCWNPVQPNTGVELATPQSGVYDEEDCKALCLNTEKCIGLDWDKNTNGCWFQTGPLNSYEGMNINHWSLANCTGDCAPYCWRDVENDYYVPGGSLQSDIRDENNCKLRCSNTSNCTGIDWVSHGSSCYLLFTENPSVTKSGTRHWDIVKKLSTSCPITTEIPTTTAQITTIATTPHVTTAKPLETSTNKPTTTVTETLTLEASTSGYISSETSPSSFANSSDSLDSDHPNTAAIIGGVVGGFCGLVLIIILIVIITMLTRKRQRNEKFKEISDDVSLQSDLKQNRSRPTIPRKPKQLPSLPKPSTDPVSLTQLSSHFANLNSSMGRFKQEFDSLPVANYESCSAARGSDNAAKRNRFKNILPYDPTRVKLLVQNNGASDYINANYIQGYDGAQKAYIAAQGPLKTTLNDFWQMIWNDGLNRVIMITQLMEQGKCKCEKYWPDGVNGSKEFNKVTVTLVECHICTDYAKRVMRLEHKEYNETRLVTQLQFTIWNDKGIPSEVYPLLAFRKRVRVLDEEAAGPMLVHCSAGVGRTGTFIALDCLLEQAEKTNQVSVFGVVKKLREQRMVMVQVLDQYKLLYEAILEANKTGVTEIDRRTFKKTFSTAIVDQNFCFPQSLTESSELEFSLLEDIKKRNAVVNEKSAGLQHDNLDKNRYKDTIPDDKVRIYLLPTSHQSDYINAVLTQGHRCPGHYILTQLPLKETIADFWRMVTEYNCPTIVVLVPPNESDEMTYWPLEHHATLQFGKISVTLSSRVTAGEIIGLELHLTRSGSLPQIVQLYRLSSWSLEAPLPNSSTAILDLIGLMSDRHHQLMNPSEDAAADKNLKPAVIICPDGANKSGLFVAASYAIDKMKSDRLVDAYLSSRYVISSRPQAIVSLVQYRYIFQLVAEHLRWTPTIAMDFAAAQVTDDIYVNANQDSNDANHPIYQNS